MTIDNELARADAVGNGVTTVFAYGFRIFDDDDLVVKKTDTTGVETVMVKGVDYTVQGVNDDDGGSVTLTVALPNLYKLAITRDMAYTQPDQFGNNSEFYPENHERAFDRMVILILQLREILSRALILSSAEAGGSVELANKILRANKFLKFDANGDPTVADVLTPGALTVSAFIQTLLDDLSAAAARLTLGFTGAGSTVPTALLEDLCVTTAKLAAASVTNAKLGVGAVLTANLGDDSVDATKLKDDAAVDGNRAVNTNHIRDLAVTTPKIADNAVTTAKILDGQVTPAKLSAAVTAGDGTISWAKLKKTLVYDQAHNWNQNGQTFEFETYNRDGLSRPAIYFFDVEYTGGGSLAGQNGEVTLQHHVKAGDGTKEGKRFKIASVVAGNVPFNLKIYKLSLT